MASIEGVRLKIKQAHDHLDTLNDEVKRLTDDLYENGVIKKIEPQTGDYVWRINADPSSADDCGLIAGDLIHNLRAALDHVVYELATQDRPLTEFPIYLKPGPGRDGFHEAGIAKMWSLPLEAKVIIERFQPYSGWNGLKDKAHPLWQIHDLDRIDKHRRLLTVPYAATTSADIVVTNPVPSEPYVIPKMVGGWMINSTGHFEHGDEVARLYYSLANDGIENLHLKYRFQVSIKEEGIAPGPIAGQLGDMYNFVCDEVLPALDSFFN
jgi:hypothetical protein